MLIVAALCALLVVSIFILIDFDLISQFQRNVTNIKLYFSDNYELLFILFIFLLIIYWVSNDFLKFYQKELIENLRYFFSTLPQIVADIAILVGTLFYVILNNYGNNNKNKSLAYIVKVLVITDQYFRKSMICGLLSIFFSLVFLLLPLRDTYIFMCLKFLLSMPLCLAVISIYALVKTLLDKYPKYTNIRLDQIYKLRDDEFIFEELVTKNVQRSACLASLNYLRRSPLSAKLFHLATNTYSKRDLESYFASYFSTITLDRIDNSEETDFFIEHLEKIAKNCSSFNKKQFNYILYYAILYMPHEEKELKKLFERLCEYEKELSTDSDIKRSDNIKKAKDYIRNKFGNTLKVIYPNLEI